MPPTTTRSSTPVVTGPGNLYVAPIGTAEPASATAVLDAAWREVGYTESGVTIGTNITAEDTFVAEELDPLRTDVTQRTSRVVVQLAQAERQNLALALNMGANAANDGTTLEPPALGSELRVMGLFQTTEGARWLFRRMFNVGGLEMARNKAPAKALIPVEFRLEKPTGLQPFKVYPTATGVI